MAAASAGIPHPPGAPTWVISAYSFVHLLGFRDIAYGTNVHSAFWGAITLGFVCFLCQVWSVLIFPLARRSWIPIASGIVGVLVLVHSPAFLEQSFTTEQYTLLTGILGAILTVATLLYVGRNGSRRRLRAGCMLMGLLWGLAIGNHLSQVALGLLMVLCIAALVRRESLVRDLIDLSLWCGLGLCLGLLVFLWLPIRSKANPLIDWGNIETWDRFVWAVTRKAWPKRPISEAPAGFVSEWLLTYDLLGELGIGGFFLLLVGILCLVKYAKLWFAWIAAAFVPYAAGLMLGHMAQQGITITYIRSYGVSDWHIPIYFGCALLAAMGAAWAFFQLREAHVRPLAPWVAGATVAGLVVVSAFSIYHASLRNWTAPAHFIHDALAPLPDGITLVVNSDNHCHTLGYDQWVTQRGKQKWLAYSNPCAASVVALAASSPKGWNEETKVRFLTQRIADPKEQPLNVPRLSPDKARATRFFTEFQSTYAASARYMLPRGFLFEVFDHETSDSQVREADRKWKQEFPESVRQRQPGAHRLEREARSVMHSARAGFFFARQMWPEAAEEFALALDWTPDDGQMWYCLGYADEQLGKRREAAEQYMRAIHYTPWIAGPRLNLASIFAENGMLEQAAQFLRDELRIDPASKEARANLALVEKRLAQAAKK